MALRLETSEEDKPTLLESITKIKASNFVPEIAFKNKLTNINCIKLCITATK